MHTRIRGRRAVLATVLAVSALTVVAVAPTVAITDGTLDGTNHPWVGLMVASEADGDPLWRCSGTLLSDSVYITAGHCVETPAAHIEIWFSEGPIPLGAGYPAAGAHPCAGITGYPCTGDVGGDPHQNPLWNPDAFFLHDVGIVTLDDTWSATTYGALPEVGSLSDLPVGPQTWFTAVGYGLQKSFPDAAAWKNQAARTRYVAYPYLLQVDTPGFTGDFSLLLSNNAASGGTCFGDSGGPNFLGASNTIAAVTSFGLQRTCGGTGGVYRLDRESDRAWILSWLD
jgi:hypothetical protein